MAVRFFEENTHGEVSAQFFVQALLQGKDLSPVLKENNTVRMQRVRLYARGDSAFLTGIFRNAVIKTWLEGSGKNWEDLSFEDRFDLHFVIGGLTSILGTPELSDSPPKLLSFTQREIGAAARETLNRIRRKDGEGIL